MAGIKGKVYKYGDDINTDVIFPGKYTYTVTDPQENGPACHGGPRPGFSSKPWNRTTLWWAVKNFGCGSSREQAV